MGVTGVSSNSNGEKIDSYNSVNTTNGNVLGIDNNLTSYKGDTEIMDLTSLASSSGNLIVDSLKAFFDGIQDFAGDIGKVIASAQYMTDKYDFKLDIFDIRYDIDNQTIIMGDSRNDDYIVVHLDERELGSHGEMIAERHWGVDERKYTDYILPNGEQWRCAESTDSFSDGSRIIKNVDTGEYFCANDKLEDVTSNIFGEWNNKSGQFGGSQMDFRNNNLELIQDSKIQNIIKAYWPDATEEDMSMLLYKLCNCGCGYTACINSIFIEYQGREDEFLEKFGFPMYTKREDGVVDYNYEYLILEYFLYVNAHDDKGKLHEISDLYGEVDSDVEDGAVGKTVGGSADGTSHEDVDMFADFLKEKYGVSVNVECIGNGATPFQLEVGSEEYDRAFKKLEEMGLNVEYGMDLYGMPDTNEDLAKLIQEYLDEGKQITINGSSYALDGEKIGGHVVEVVEINDNGEIIVSSWGKQYVLDIEKFDALYGIAVFDY